MVENKEKIIRKIARRVVTKYNLSPPVNFSEIFADRGIIFIEDNLGTNGDGYSDLCDSNLKIVVNVAMDYEPRKRFTIAHELGHIFIGWHDDITLCKMDNEYIEHNMLDIQEKEANIFASELLMPTEWIQSKIQNRSLDDLKSIIDELCSQAKTSIMACFYALENAMPSGNVILVSREGLFPKKFITQKTCEVYCNGMDFQETCNVLSMSCKMYEISYYKIFHYRFLECPSKEQILQFYEQNRELLLTLELLTENKIFLLLHCLKSILKIIDEKYIVYVFHKEDQFLRFASENVELQVPYVTTKHNFISFCDNFGFGYNKKVICGEYEIMAVKEPNYIMPTSLKSYGYDSKKLLNMILEEIYEKELLNKVRMSISGIIGSVNSGNIRRNSTKEKLYDSIQKRMRKDGFENLVRHKYFNEFVYLKTNELYERR